MNYEVKDFESREKKIRECCTSLYKKIEQIVPQKPVEADFRHVIDQTLDDFCQDLQLNPLTHMEYTLFSGRADAVFNRLVIEYKKPGVLKNPPNEATRAAIEQLKGYLVDLAKKEHHKLDRVAGALLDGNYIIFLRYRGQSWLEESPLELNNESLYRLLSWLTSLSSGIALTADNLTRDFSIEQLMTQTFLRSLFQALQNALKISNSLPSKLYEQWKIFFSEAIDYSEAFGGRELEPLKKWVKKAGIEIKTPEDAQEFFFVLHTYFALLAKFLAWLAISRYFGVKLGAPAFGELATIDGDELRRKLTDMESGGIFRQYGILNLLEGDFFSWYLKAWDNKIEETLRLLLRRLDEYDPTTLTIKPEETRDLFKKLYHYILPREIRHNLGEYYTPDWLAQHVLNLVDKDIFGEAPEKKERILKKKLLKTRFLDPACGSGTFLVLIITRMRELGSIFQLRESYLLESILNNVVGFDINPLAVLTSRVNYLLAIADLIEHRRTNINIPVYLTDSVRTPSMSDDIFKQNAYEFPTAIGKYLVPAVLCEGGRFDRFCEKLEDALNAELPLDSFIKKIENTFELETSPKWDDLSVSQLSRLYESLLDYHRKGLNGLWARLLKNNFAPLVLGEFDYIVGNPPWINWEHLPDVYRRDIGPLWSNYNLFSYKGFEAILGKSKDDISIIMTYVVTDKLLKTGGKLAFLITQSVFKTSGGGKGFRTFSINKKGQSPLPLGVLMVDDMVKLKPFEGASNRTAVFLIKKGEPTTYPVPYILWRKKKNFKFTYESTFNEVIQATQQIEFQAEPIDLSDKTSSWITARPRALKAVRKILGKSDYIAHAGAYTGGANAVYWVETIMNRADGLVIVRNITEGAKIKVSQVTEPIEPDLLYPLLRGRDVQRWHAEPSAQIIIAHKPGMRLNAIPGNEMASQYFATYKYLKQFEGVLRQRASRGIKDMINKGAPFYTMFAIGDYTFAPWKVVWREQFSYMVASVVGTADDKPIIPDHKLMLISLTDKTEANYLCSMINSKLTVFVVLSYAVEIQMDPHILEHIRIPRFDRKNEFHLRLSELSEQAHEAVHVGDDEKLKQIEEEIDRTAAKIWGLTDEELMEIQESLRELDGDNEEEPTEENSDG